jgi:hypothetical protein
MAAFLRLAFVFLVIWSGGWCGARQGGGERQSAEDVRFRIAGTWRGNSICGVKDSPCRDEVNVYQFSGVAGRPDIFRVTAAKVVDGKEVVMGRGEWKYDAERRVVECERPAIRLALDGDKMEGALTLGDGTVYRRISLKKEK